MNRNHTVINTGGGMNNTASRSNSTTYNRTVNETGNGTVPITPYSPHQRLRLDQQLPQSSSAGLHAHAHHQGGNMNMNMNMGSGVMSGNGSGFSPPRMMTTLTTAGFPSPVHSAGVGMGVGVGMTTMGVNVGGGLHGPDHRVFFGADPVRNPDGSPLLDHDNNPIPVAKMLATKPLRAELSTRPGPGGKKLTYISGDSVTRTLNDVFGFDGWCLEVKETRQESREKDEKGRWNVSYTALVRVTHRLSGAFKEDCGAGDSTDKSLGTAVSHALKASVTDALKRAVRHFGDKLGNSLYESNFGVSKAPVNLKDALNKYAIERAKSKFGFDKDRKKPGGTATSDRVTRGTTSNSSGISVGNGIGTVKEQGHTTSTVATKPSNVNHGTNHQAVSFSTSSNAVQTVARTPASHSVRGNSLNQSDIAAATSTSTNGHNSNVNNKYQKSSPYTIGVSVSNSVTSSKPKNSSSTSLSAYKCTPASSVVSTTPSSSLNKGGYVTNQRNGADTATTSISPNGLARFQQKNNPSQQQQKQTSNQPISGNVAPAQYSKTANPYSSQNRQGKGNGSGQHSQQSTSSSSSTSSIPSHPFANRSRPNVSHPNTSIGHTNTPSIPQQHSYPGQVTHTRANDGTKTTNPNALLDISSISNKNANGKRISPGGNGAGNFPNAAKVTKKPYGGPANPYLSSK